MSDWARLTAERDALRTEVTRLTTENARLRGDSQWAHQRIDELTAELARLAADRGCCGQAQADEICPSSKWSPSEVIVASVVAVTCMIALALGLSLL